MLDTKKSLCFHQQRDLMKISWKISKNQDGAVKIEDAVLKNLKIQDISPLIPASL